MHLALSSPGEADFSPEKLSPLYQRSLFQSMRTLVRKIFHSLRGGMGGLPEPCVRGPLQSSSRRKKS